ncbi:MAG: hypothetical protein K5781_03740, partial [Nitrosopumilus sp.]|nr:hypothetical protein [Nitrosopumilus sp.]
MKSAFSLIAILFLLTSGIPFGFAESPSVDSPYEQSEIVSSTPKESRTISISLEESIGIKSNPPQKKNSEVNSNTVSESGHSKTNISLSEDLNLISSALEESVLHITFISQPQVIIERITQTDKTRDDRKKNSKIETLYLDDSHDQYSSDVLISIPTNILETSFFSDPFNFVSINQIDFDYVINSLNVFDKSFTNTLDSFPIFDLSFVSDNSFIIIIFTPLVFFLFIFAEDVKFKFEKIRPLLSFVCVFIILSTVIVTPYSISSSYWPEAYADTGDLDQNISDNTTASTDNTSSSSTPAEDTETVEDSTSDSTDASVGSTSSSSTPAEDTESTEVSSSTQPTASTDNTSSSSTPAEDTETVEDSTSDSTDASVGSTSSSSTPAEDTESTEVSSNQTSINTLVGNNVTSSLVPINNSTDNQITTNQNSTEIILVNSTETTIPVNGTISGTNSTETTIPVNGTISGTNS